MVGDEAVPDVSTEQTLDELIVDLTNRYDVPADRYPWANESERWYELAFCTLASVGEPDVPPERARAATEVLRELDLLQLQPLTDSEGADVLDDPDSTPRLVRNVLVREGFDEETADRAAVALCDVARSLRERHDGNVQQYLRQYGAQMVEDAPEQFELSGEDDAVVRRVVTLWLQNVLNMPVGRSTAAVEDFCDRYDVTFEELVAAADRTDVNLALVDDLVAQFVTDLEAEEQEVGETSGEREVSEATGEREVSEASDKSEVGETDDDDEDG